MDISLVIFKRIIEYTTSTMNYNRVYSYRLDMILVRILIQWFSLNETNFCACVIMIIA